MEKLRTGEDGTVEATLSSEDGRDRAERAVVVHAAPASFRQLYDEQHAFVFRSLLHLGVSASAVDDAMQETFVVVHRRLPTYDVGQPLRAWLWGIARNVAHNQRRTASREHRRRDALADEPTQSADTSLERSTELGVVREVLLAMDEPMRDVLVLSDVEGLTAPEIAAALEVNVNTVYSRLRVARQRFADAVGRRERLPGRTSGGGKNDGR